MPTHNEPGILQCLCGIGSLTVSDMVRHSRKSARQAECLLDTWYLLRRSSAESHARKRAAIVAAGDAVMLHEMQSFGGAVGAVPDHPQTLAQSLESPRAIAEAGRDAGTGNPLGAVIGRFGCGGKGVNIRFANESDCP